MSASGAIPPAPPAPGRQGAVTLGEFAQVFQIIAQATTRFLDNTRDCQERASEALILHHGMLVLAMHNRELSLRHIQEYRERLQLVLKALDEAEAELKEKH